jgi:hypothetical protein
MFADEIVCQVEELTKFDVTILESKKTLETVRAEYLEAKAQYEDSLAKLTIMSTFELAVGLYVW